MIIILFLLDIYGFDFIVIELIDGLMEVNPVIPFLPTDRSKLVEEEACVEGWLLLSIYMKKKK